MIDVRRPDDSRPPAPVHAPPRVALFAFDLPGEPRSAVAYARSLARALAARGSEIHLFINAPAAAPAPGVREQQVLSTEPDLAGVPLARNLCAALSDHVARAMREYGAFQVAHACQWSSAPAALVARRHGAVRAVVSFLDTVFSRDGACNRDERTAQVRRIEQQAAQEADALVAGSESVRQELAWLYGADEKRVHTWYADALEEEAAPDSAAARAALRLAPDDRAVAFAGDWSPAGGSDLFLELARLLRLQEPALRFCVAVEGAGAARVEADIKRRGLGDAFRFAPASAGADAALAACDVAVVPARVATSYRPVFRAWRAARPVVVARTGPTHVLEAGRTGVLAFPYAQALADAVAPLLADRAAAAAMGDAGRRALDHAFTWPHTAINLTKLYRATAAAPAGRPETIHGA